MITKSKIIFLFYIRWQYNPISKTNGNFFKTKPLLSLQKTLQHHGYTDRLKESGYTNNHYTMDKTGWTPHETLNGDQKRTEYRIQHNPKKDIHYKGPKFSTGKLLIKETNYKHT